MQDISQASLNLLAAVMLQERFRDGTASERADAVRAVLQARADLAAARSRLAMQPRGGES